MRRRPFLDPWLGHQHRANHRYLNSETFALSATPSNTHDCGVEHVDMHCERAVFDVMHKTNAATSATAYAGMGYCM
jgi:hypothetical protein